MNKLDQLFVRACKSKNPDVRILSIYRRFYYGVPSWDSIAALLARICDEHMDIRVGTLLSDLSPVNAWKYGTEEETPYWERVVRVLTSKIRTAKIDNFEGLTPPLRFRHVKLP